ncbi:MAG: YdjY domain-containing protein [Pirellulales bacterium]
MATAKVLANWLIVCITATLLASGGTGCQKKTDAGPKNLKKSTDTPKADDGAAGGESDAQAGAASEAVPAKESGDKDNPKFAFQEFPVPEHFHRIADKQDIWLDKQNRAVVAHGEICLREGLLELLICEEGGKTHESVIKVKGKPSTIHAGLLLVGGRQGTPVKFEPEHKPATGSEIDIFVKYVDTKGKVHEVPGQRFVRNKNTNKALTHPWVFAGSFFYEDDTIKKKLYMADEAGEFVCVVNFPSATLDLPIPSSQANENLMFDAFTENIPLVGTKVQVTFKPKIEKAKKDEPAGEATE